MENVPEGNLIFVRGFEDYDPPMSTARHPIDSELRTQLRQLFKDQGHGAQADVARRTGCNQSWLHKYANGAGHASVDDAIRIAAVLSGVTAAGLNPEEMQLLRAWRQLPDDGTVREDALHVFENHVAYVKQKAKERQPHARESSVRAGHTPRTAKHKGHGTP